jgi:prepilin-type N-terminal cleavage/methylation domain-containing protein
MRERGFTLIELMIVIAIIAILAAIAIPGILAAVRAANERNASASLKQILPVQVNFKTNDLDQNSINDYWTADVAGLFYVRPTGSQSLAQMIELSVALADANTDPTNPAVTYSMPAIHRSSPKAGYWFQRQFGMETAAGTILTYGRKNTDRFSFIAYPHSYGSSGKLCFFISEGGTQWKRDPGSSSAVLINPPLVDVPNTNAVLNSTIGSHYGVAPFNPHAGPGAPYFTARPWSKMD